MSATASVRVTVSGIGSGGQPMIEKKGKALHIFIQVKLTNTVNYPTGGDTLDLTAIFSTTGLPGYNFPTSSSVEKLELQSVLGTGTAQTGLFLYSYVPGTTLANGKIQVFTGAAAQSPLAELSAGVYPAGVLQDIIEGELIIPIP